MYLRFNLVHVRTGAQSQGFGDQVAQASGGNVAWMVEVDYSEIDRVWFEDEEQAGADFPRMEGCN